MLLQVVLDRHSMKRKSERAWLGTWRGFLGQESILRVKVGNLEGTSLGYRFGEGVSPLGNRIKTCF